MRWVAGLAEFGRTDVASAGGKAANLGELVRAGFPVPDGFVVSTEAYRRFVDQNDVAARILTAAREATGDRTGPAGGGAADLRAVPLPGSGCRAASRDRPCLRTARRAGRCRPFIRDGRGSSGGKLRRTTGQLSQRAGSAALLAAVVDCWASLWTSRALAYRERQGIAPEDVSLAVVVQDAGRGRRSGRAVHRESGQRPPRRSSDQRGMGAGEAIVGGLVDTDEIVVDKVSGRC